MAGSQTTARITVNITDDNGLVLERFALGDAKGELSELDLSKDVRELLEQRFTLKCPRGAHVESSYWLKDARGIEVAKVCDVCVEEVKAGYRPEIFTDSQYETTEDVEPDGDALFLDELPDTDAAVHEAADAIARRIARQRQADRVDGYDRDDLGESPDY